MNNLFQPILSTTPEYGHKPDEVLHFSEFIRLIREEEDYFNGEELNTKLMITRLRKIFYDKWGWDTQLIRGAADILCRYEVKIINCPSENDITYPELKQVKWYINNIYSPKCRLVTYRNNDRVYGGSRVGIVPYIYKHDHQDVLLPEGYYCDIAHVLAGLDAFNYPQAVGPKPDCPPHILKYFPYADSNADVVTWLGDIATTAADFLMEYLRTDNTPVNEEREQFYITINASGSDMLGNIDSYVINHCFKTGLSKGRCVSDILSEYYSNDTDSLVYRKKRIELFCNSVGLKDWDGKYFINESEWLTYYQDQLRNTTSFMVYSIVSEPVKRLLIPMQIQRKKYEEVIKVELLLNLFLTALKKLL